MSAITWYEDGIYSRTRRLRSGETVEVIYGRVWVLEQRRFAYFKLGTSPQGTGVPQVARMKMRRILGNPLAAVEARARQRVKVLTFGALLDEFLRSYRSRGGTRYYHSVLKAARAFLGETPVTSINAELLDRHLMRRRTETTKGVKRVVNGEKVMVGAGRRRISESTLRKELIGLGTVFRWAKRRGLVAVNPLADYEKPKEPSERHIAILSPEQELVLLAHLPPLERDVVEWALYSGMRRGEVFGLRWKDIDRARGVAHIVAGKTGKARVVPLTLSERLPAILDRHPRRINTDWIFHDQQGKPLDMDVMGVILEKAARAAGVPKDRGVLWNRLRHTWATRLAATGKVSLFEVSKIMGNSVTICEKHYAAYVPGAHKRLAGLLDRAPIVAGVVAESEDANHPAPPETASDAGQRLTT